MDCDQLQNNIISKCMHVAICKVIPILMELLKFSTYECTSNDASFIFSLFARTRRSECLAGIPHSSGARRADVYK